MGTIFVTREELAAGIKLPTSQHTRIVLVPKAICASLLGAAFDTNKTFLLPQCLPGLQQVHQLLLERGEGELLIVGHTDASGEAVINDPLSLGRAKMAKAWVEGDVEAWLANYSGDVSDSQRWGAREDGLMIRTLLADQGAGTQAEQDPVRRYQFSRGLQVDGIAGPQTRGALIKEYFARARGDSIDGGPEEPATDERQLGLPVTPHGAGENYPLSAIRPILEARKNPNAPKPRPSVKPSATDAATEEDDDEDEPLDRRIEFFLFSPKTGIDPKPGEAGGPEYLRWVTDATVRKELIVEDTRHRLPVVEFEDVLFNTNSAVPLPSSDEESQNVEGPFLGTPLSVARVLSYAYEHSQQGLHVSGHADTTADARVNDPLSYKRALAVLALIEGDRETFKTTVDAQCVDADKDAVLRWADEEFEFRCSPERHRNNRVEAIKAFQSSYNGSVERNDAGQPELEVDGDWGPLTWGAAFDLYEAEIAHILDGERGNADRELLAAYRDQLRFADDQNKAKGYGERYPIEHKRKNNFRSRANRRVEVLFLDAAETPSLGGAPDDSIVFDDVIFRRVPLPFDGFEPLKIRYALLPTEYTERRTFPKPSSLPLLRRVVERARRNESLTVVVVGHTDHLLTNEDNERLSLARAEAVKALLTHDLETFKQRFEAPDPFEAWGFEEVQWMLHALSSEAGPFYVGEADGHAGYTTRGALGSYQLSKGMNVDDGCDAATLEALCKDYLALIPEPLDAQRIRTVAAGSWTPSRLVEEAGARDSQFRDESEPSEGEVEVISFNRRVELFLFERPVVPTAESIDSSTHRTSPTYRKWARRADPQGAASPIDYAIRLFDARRVPIPNVAFQILRLNIERGEFENFSKGSLNAFGTASAKLPPGPYRVDFSVGGSVESFALHSHVDHSAGLAARLRGRS